MQFVEFIKNDDFSDTICIFMSNTYLDHKAKLILIFIFNHFVTRRGASTSHYRDFGGDNN